MISSAAASGTRSLLILIAWIKNESSVDQHPFLPQGASPAHSYQLPAGGPDQFDGGLCAPQSPALLAAGAFGGYGFLVSLKVSLPGTEWVVLE